MAYQSDCMCIYKMKWIKEEYKRNSYVFSLKLKRKVSKDIVKHEQIYDYN